MLTPNQILNARTFHLGTCTTTTGPRGGVKHNVEHARRASRTKTWKTRPGAFAFTIKTGWSPRTRTITQADVENMHASEDCPIPSMRF
jgi:hypothetical protein